MFERFARDSRSAVVGAQHVARDAGSRGIDTRHVLLALMEGTGSIQTAMRDVGTDVSTLSATLRADLRAGGLDGDALAALGIDLDAVRRQTDAVFGAEALERAGRAPRGHIPFTPDAKKGLELALREAIRLKQKSIQSTHLLLGILRAECPGRLVLTQAGVQTEALRRVLEEQSAAA